jgi:hypothetical protein
MARNWSGVEPGNGTIVMARNWNDRVRAGKWATVRARNWNSRKG